MVTVTLSRSRATAIVLALALAFSLLALMPGAGSAQDASSPPPEIVVLARSDNPADALGAGPVAGILGAPVLVTPGSRLLPVTAEALEAFDPDLVVLAGGVAALSEQVEADVNALGYSTRRAAGSDRHETAALLAGLLAEYQTGRPVLTGTPVTDQVIPGLNAERLGGLTVEELLAAIEGVRIEARAYPFVLRDHDPQLDIEHPGSGYLVTNTLELDLPDHCDDGSTVYQVMAESKGAALLEGGDRDAIAQNLLVLAGEIQAADNGSFEPFAGITIPRMDGDGQGIATVANQRLFELEAGSHTVESTWTSTGYPYQLAGPTLYLTVHGWSCADD